MSHDLVKRYLENSKLTSRDTWKQVKEDVVESESGYIVFDDTVLDKNFSKKIDSVRWQYSGNAHSIIRGIGLVNCVYINPETEQFWVIDFRIFDPDKDGKSKVDHVREMIDNIINHKKLAFKTVLMDTWYANHQLMLHINDAEKLFYCPIKKNRLGRLANTDQKYRQVSLFDWNDNQLSMGQLVQLKGMPKHIPLKMFSIAVSANRIDCVVTNDTSQTCSDDTKKICAIRWYVEQFHREVKQLTGIEQCQCRKQRIQRNHIACAIHVWIFLKRMAYQTQKTVYKIKHDLLKDYLVQQLNEPTLKMSFA